MKKSIFIVGLLLFLSPWKVSAQTPTLVYASACANSSSLSGNAWSSTPAYQCNLPETSTAGDTLIFSFGFDNTGGNQNFTVSDDGGDMFTLDVSSATNNNKQLRIYRAVNIAPGSTYVRVTLNTGQLNGYWQPTVAEFFNAAALDGSQCNTGASTTVTAGSITPTVSGDLLYQVSYYPALSYGTPGQTSFAPGSQSGISWALAFELLGDGAAAQYGVYNSTSAINPTFTQGSSASFISCAVALKAASTGSALTVLPRVLHQTHDAMPKNHPIPWNIGATSTGDTVYFAYMGNDAISGVTSTPSPSVVNWTASGADFNGLNGHNHANIYCAKFSSPPGAITITLTTVATTNDSINMIYDVVGGSCNVDADSVGQAGDSTSAATSLTICNGCITPTKVNDFVLAEEGQAFCTATSLVTPTTNFDAGWFQGNNISGPSQTDENNFWAHFRNPNLNAITVTLQDTCGGSAIGNWAGRVVAYQSAGTTIVLQPPTGLTAIVH